MKAVYKKELKAYFQSIIGCVFIAFLIAFTGIYFMAYNMTTGYPYFSDSIFMGWYLISVSKYGDERTCVYNFAYFAGSFLHMENDEQFFDCGRSGLCRSGSSDSSVFSERDAL